MKSITLTIITILTLTIGLTACEGEHDQLLEQVEAEGITAVCVDALVSQTHGYTYIGDNFLSNGYYCVLRNNDTRRRIYLCENFHLREWTHATSLDKCLNRISLKY